VFALGAEELCPGNYFWMLLEQGAALTFGHSAPDAELDAIVEGVGSAFQDDRAMPADDGGFALGSTANEQFVGICLSASGLGHPCDTGFGFRAVDSAVGCCVRRCPARRGLRT
jgi:hypothetical protein